MSIKCKYRDIKAIYDWYEEYGDETARQLVGTFPETHVVAYYSPADANWSYQIGLVEVGAETYEVVLVYGQVKAGRLAYLPHYATMEDVKNRR